VRKAGIITHYHVHNYGAELQLYGLIRVLEKLGYSASALKYTKNYDFINPEINAKYKISFKSIPIYLKYLRENGICRTLYNIKKKIVLNSFEKKFFTIGEYYSSVKDLDAVVVGSDEIFSLEAGPNPWYWGIGVQCDNVISYAASFGPTDMEFINKYRCRELVYAGLSRIRTISVRDKHSKDLVAEITGREAEIVCDPVFLYGFEEELKKTEKVCEERFAIVYAYDGSMNDNSTVHAISKYASRLGIKIYSIGYYHNWCDMNICCSPLDVFPYFRDAEVVFTDTFHGSVLSILCSTPLVVRINANENKLRFLLNQHGLENQIVSSFIDLERAIENPIDFNSVLEFIRRRREMSLRYLKESLENTEE